MQRPVAAPRSWSNRLLVKAAGVTWQGQEHRSVLCGRPSKIQLNADKDASAVVPLPQCLGDGDH